MHAPCVHHCVQEIQDRGGSEWVLFAGKGSGQGQGEFMHADVVIDHAAPSCPVCSVHTARVCANRSQHSQQTAYWVLKPFTARARCLPTGDPAQSQRQRPWRAITPLRGSSLCSLLRRVDPPNSYRSSPLPNAKQCQLLHSSVHHLQPCSVACQAGRTPVATAHDARWPPPTPLVVLAWMDAWMDGWMDESCPHHGPPQVQRLCGTMTYLPSWAHRCWT